MRASAETERERRGRWVVCASPNEKDEVQHFETEEAAIGYRDEVLSPATIDGPLLLSPHVQRVPDDLASWHLRGLEIKGEVSPVLISIGGRLRIPVRTIERESSWTTWIVFELEDGQEWPSPEYDGEGPWGVGAYRETEDPYCVISPHELPRGYQPEVRRDQCSLEVVPVKSLADFAGPSYSGPRFAEYLPADELVAERRVFSVEGAAESLSDAMNYGSPKFTCDLGSGWLFDEMSLAARREPACSFRNRQVKSPSRQVALIAHALERRLLLKHKELSPEAVAAFWTSWSVWHFLATWCRKLYTELDRRRPGLQLSWEVAAHAIQREAWQYAKAVLDPQEPRRSADRLVAPANAADRRRIAANLSALVQTSRLSVREIARRIGPADGDPKAVREHCNGRREARTPALWNYAALFSKLLNRRITPEQIRVDDLTVTQEDSAR